METIDRRAVLLSLILAFPAMAELPAQHSCTLRQLERTRGFTGLHHVTADFNRFVILSSDDLSGRNSDGSLELFVLDLSRRIVEQITDFPLNPIRVFGADLQQLSQVVGVSDDLNRIVFAAPHDLTGGNPDQSSELFLLERPTGEITQLTDIVSRCASVPAPCLIEEVLSAGGAALSRDGRLLAYRQSRNGVMEFPGGERINFIVSDVFLRNLDDGSVLQLTDAQPDFSEPFAPSEQFGPVGFRSDGAILVYQKSLLSPNGIATETFLYDVATGRVERFLPNDATASAPRFSPDGSLVLFHSRLDYVGGNPEGLRQLFVMNTDTRAIRQVGRITQGPLLEESSLDFAISGDNAKLARIVQETHYRPENPLEVGSSGSRLLYYDLRSDTVNQVAFTERVIRRDSNGNVDIVGFFLVGSGLEINQDGSRLAFNSRVDLTGDNPTNLFQDFLGSCAPAAERFVAQVGDGTSGDLRAATSFIFTNVGDAATVEIDFFGSDGQPLAMEVADQGRGSKFRLPIRGGESLTVQTTGQANPLSVGYARIVAPPAVGGTAIFTRADARQEVVLYEAGIPIGAAIGEFTVPIEDVGDRRTGLALAAPPPSGASERSAAQQEEFSEVRLRLYDTQTALLGEQAVRLRPGEHRAFFVRELFPEAIDATTGETRGVLVANSSSPVAVAALRQAENPSRSFPQAVPTLTTFPVVPSAPSKTPPAVESGP